MSRVAIVTDSACDLSKALQEKHGITVVPLVIRFGQEVYLYGQITLEQYWEKVSEGTHPPETSQPSAGQFEQAFAPLVEKGYHVLCLTVTSKHSGTFNSAYAASQSFPGKVTVFDTLAISLGHGYQVIAAAEAAAAGRSVEDILVMLESIRARTHMVICLDTIEFIRRGGRADKLIPALDRMTRVFKIKVLLHVVAGELKPMGVARSRAKSVLRMKDDIARHGPAEMLIVAHTRLPDEVASLAESLAEQEGFPLHDILVGEVGPALSSHAGPYALAAAIVPREAR